MTEQDPGKTENKSSGLKIILDDGVLFPFTPGLVAREIEVAVRYAGRNVDYDSEAVVKMVADPFIALRDNIAIDVMEARIIEGLASHRPDYVGAYHIWTVAGRSTWSMLKAFDQIEARASPDIIEYMRKLGDDGKLKEEETIRGPVKNSVRCSSREFLKLLGKSGYDADAFMRARAGKLKHWTNDAITTTLISAYADMFQMARSGAMKHAVDSAVGYLIGRTEIVKNHQDILAVYNCDKRPSDMASLEDFEVSIDVIKK